eukprot:gene24854-30288_t
MSALASIEAKKKYIFLEAFASTMDAHMRFFKQGYEVLKDLEPLIHQVLTYTQQTRDVAERERIQLAERMAEARRQNEERQNAASGATLRPSSSHGEGEERDMSANLRRTVSVDPGMLKGQPLQGKTCHQGKRMEDIAQMMKMGDLMGGPVPCIKQGYMLKRSSSLRADWKRRFFVLNAKGMLFYYRSSKDNKILLSRADKTEQQATVNLLTSTIKMDIAEDPGLRFCFRIVSPEKTYSLQ